MIEKILLEKMDDILKNRAKIIEQFAETWLAINLPENMGAEEAVKFWVNDCALCEKHIDGRIEMWIKKKESDHYNIDK